MKKAMKLLAAVLALVLVIGSIPIQAASTPSLKSKKAKILYIDGCKGKKANGTAAKFSDSVTATKLLKNFKSKTMSISLKSSDAKVCTVSSKKITAVGRGTATVTITVKNKSTEKVIAELKKKITVKKSASKDFSITGIEDGAEYEVGKKLTVVMTRAEDDDYRKLTCDNSAATLTKKNSYGSKYVVTLKEAGTYTFTATAYQSATYDGATAKKTVTVTVKEEAKPTPTEEPTPTPSATPTEEPTPTPSATPTEEPTPTPTAAPAGITIKQISVDTVLISGLDKIPDFRISNCELYYIEGGNEIYNNNGLKEDYKVVDDGIQVSALSYFQDNVEYYISYKGSDIEPVSFKAVSATPKDIVDIEITNSSLLVNTEEDLGVRFFAKDHIDITDKVAALAPVTLNITSGELNAFPTTGTKMCFVAPNVTAVVELTVDKGITEVGDPITYKKTFVVKSYEPEPNGLIYTITTDDGVYMKADDPQVNEFPYDAENPVIEVLFKYVDAKGNVTYKTLDEEGITGIKISNDSVALAGVKTSAGGYKLIANTTGGAAVIFCKGDKEYPLTAKFTIKAKREVKDVELTLSKSLLNTYIGSGDELEIKAVVKDQYGNEFKGQTITIEQYEGTKTSTGYVSFGTFDPEGKLKVKCSDVMLNSGVTTGPISATVACGNIKKTINFRVGEYDKATSWALVSNANATSVSIDTAIKAGDVKPQELKLYIEGKNSGFSVTKEIIKFYKEGKVPSPSLTASDLGVSPGDKVYLYTIEKDGKFLTTLPNCITDTSNELIFTAFDAHVQLEKGTYVVKAYAVTAGADKSTIGGSPLTGTTTIYVTNNQPKIEAKQVKEKTAYADPKDVVKDCFEFYLEGKKIEAPVVKNVDYNIGGDGQIFVKSVEIEIYNNTYLEYNQKVEIKGKTIYHS